MRRPTLRLKEPLAVRPKLAWVAARHARKRTTRMQDHWARVYRSGSVVFNHVDPDGGRPLGRIPAGMLDPWNGPTARPCPAEFAPIYPGQAETR